MSAVAVLRSELEADPLARGYSGMDDLAVCASINEVDRTRARSLSGDEAFGATDGPEFVGLTVEKRQLWMSMTSRATISPSPANVAVVGWLFGAGSATLAALAALAVESISRAAELGLGTVYEGHVQFVRAQMGG